MIPLRVIDAATARRLLPPPAAAAVMADALRSLASFERPPRTSVALADSTVLLMPAADASGRTAVKVLTMAPADTARQAPRINGLAVLFDPDTGRARTVVDGAVLTELRTAAVSAAGTDALARLDATRLVVIGTGPQARAHLTALEHVRDWTSTTVVGRTTRRADELAAWARGQGIPATAESDAAAAVAAADVVCTTTTSASPLFPPGAVGGGTHITAIGSHTLSAREVPAEVVAGAAVFVECRAAAAAAGDLVLPDGSHAPGTEIGAVLAGHHPGRAAAEEITVFKTVGSAFEDLAVLTALDALATASDVTVVDLEGGSG